MTTLGTSFIVDEFHAINTGSSFSRVYSSDNIIYLKSTVQFYYDSDGSGLVYSCILFADFAENTILTFSQFLMVE